MSETPWEDRRCPECGGWPNHKVGCPATIAAAVEEAPPEQEDWSTEPEADAA